MSNLAPLPMSVTTTFGFDPREHYHVSRVIMRHTRLRWLIPVVLVLVTLLALFTVLVGSLQGDAWGAFLRTLPYLAMMGVWTLFIPYSQRRRAFSVAKNDPSVQGPQGRTLDEEGLHVTGNGARMDLGWILFKRAVETEDFFLFFVNWQCAHYLPKRVLSADDTARVRALTRHALGERARLRAD